MSEPRIQQSKSRRGVPGRDKLIGIHADDALFSNPLEEIAAIKEQLGAGSGETVEFLGRTISAEKGGFKTTQSLG